MKAEVFERRSASKIERIRRKVAVEEEGEGNKTAQLCSSSAARPVDAPPPRRPGHVNRSVAAAQLVAVCAPAVQLLHKPLLQRRHPASAVCVSVWVWRGHLDPIHVRNVMGVQLSGSRVISADCTAIGQLGTSWGVTRPISGWCVSRRGLVFLRGFRHFSGGGSSTLVQNSP